MSPPPKKSGGATDSCALCLDKDKMAASGLDFLSVAEMIKANNQQLSGGTFDKNDTEFIVTTGKFLETVSDVENLVVGVQQSRPIYLKQIASVQDGPKYQRIMSPTDLGRRVKRRLILNRNILP